ncbi:protein scai [Phtheirospermum japonicum]|uniref:Protein scai n=1 Tax=Phtheirospermum japonicum TaxID=374723 RepID=A0A830BR69_9LAMI|nr:protein scai [Phtheirospermum japonicum]
MQMTMMTPPSFNTELHYLNKEDRLLRWLLVKHRDVKFGVNVLGEDDVKNERGFRNEVLVMFDTPGDPDIARYGEEQCLEFAAFLDEAKGKRDISRAIRSTLLPFDQKYTQLWKFQQENRRKLVEAGLKRWEIGEIASRIGQLYFGQYMRTGGYNMKKNGRRMARVLKLSM